MLALYAGCIAAAVILSMVLVQVTGGPPGKVFGLSTHHEEQVLSPPQRREWMRGDRHEADVDWLRGLLLGLIPGVRAEAWLTKPCLIPDTPTKLPYVEIVDPGCVVAIGGNGYAAKSADAIGALRDAPRGERRGWLPGLGRRFARRRIAAGQLAAGSRP